MLAYIKGRIEYKQVDYMIIENGGIGYKVFTSLNTIQSSGAVGDEIKVYTYLYVREDNISLYGFSTPDELKMFELLISVTGIGPKAALSLMSYMSPSNFILSVIMEDVKAMTKAPGIGKKTAQRIILELKDKLKKEQGELAELTHGKDTPEIGKESGKAQEAIAALVVLGFTPLEAARAVSRVYSEEASIETLIKDSLKELK
ncbi:MAG: Holliday junction branch migration protein RuvA [Clostridiaceae bacterium]|nr:Holliday junction branch migration protein RuvA [Clostridiaceae bacterium]